MVEIVPQFWQLSHSVVDNFSFSFVPSHLVLDCNHSMCCELSQDLGRESVYAKIVRQ